MIPTGTEILILDTSEHMPSMTYHMAEEKKEIRGALDGMEAVKQAVRYNSVLGARYVIVTNGLRHLCYEFADGAYRPMTAFPVL